MKSIFAAIALTVLVPVLSHAAEMTTTSSHSCYAKEIERYYCPMYSGWWMGPYYDRGCQVSCQQDQKAVCKEASCNEYQTGEAVPSDCHCE